LDRKDKILYKCNLDGVGLEIGPSFNPILPKQEGYNVETLDVLDKKGLQERFFEHDVSKIEEVDYIWNGGSYSGLIGKTNYYDYIVASHVIEHSCDLIDFLTDCSNLLKEDGILSLAIPDKRYTFDFLKPTTGIARVLNNHGKNKRTHSQGAVYEHFSSACKTEGRTAGTYTYTNAPNIIKPIHSIEEAVEAYNKAPDPSDYIDAHAWVFTKHSFELLIYDLNSLGLTDLYVESSFETFGLEFFVSLKKRGGFTPNDDERLELAIKAHYESTNPELSSYFLKQINALEEMNVRLKEEKNALCNTFNEEIATIHNSKSWKITKPLRFVTKLFRGKGHK